MRIFFLLTILISCASPQVKPAENERSAELASENPLELKYNMKMLEGAPKMFLSMYDRDRGTDFLETETVEVISGPIALDVLQKYGAVPASDFEAELLKRSDSKVAYVKLNRVMRFLTDLYGCSIPKI